VLAAWIVFPLLLFAVCLGIGLLTEALAGRRIPGALLAPLGMASLTVVGLATTASSATASWTAPLAAVLAPAGFVLAGLQHRNLRPDPWPTLVALAVFAAFAAPVVLSGEATFAGYVKLDDTATWFAITDRLLEHGRDISSLPPSSYEATLAFNLAGWYPVGAFVPFGTGAKLAGQELAWVFQPYLALLASFTALSLWQLSERVRASAAVRRLRRPVRPARDLQTLWGTGAEEGARLAGPRPLRQALGLDRGGAFTLISLINGASRCNRGSARLVSQRLLGGDDSRPAMGRSNRGGNRPGAGDDAPRGRRSRARSRLRDRQALD